MPALSTPTPTSLPGSIGLTQDGTGPISKEILFGDLFGVCADRQVTAVTASLRTSKVRKRRRLCIGTNILTASDLCISNHDLHSFDGAVSYQLRRFQADHENHHTSRWQACSSGRPVVAEMAGRAPTGWGHAVSWGYARPARSAGPTWRSPEVRFPTRRAPQNI